MKPSLFAMSFLLIPMFDSWSSSACHDGSTFSDEKPCSAEKPMCATCLNSEGADIIDLSIFPPLAPAFGFFFAAEELFAGGSSESVSGLRGAYPECQTAHHI